MKTFFSTLFLFILSVSIHAQTEIRFTDASLEAILSIAKDRDKNVFIDTYADWCVPCKRMKEKFKDRDVAAFFNDHFINLRVDMQNKKAAKDLQRKYDVVFLPTMYILDPDGNIKYQVDREISKDELLNAAQRSLNRNSKSVIAGTTILRNDGSVQQQTSKVSTPVSSSEVVVNIPKKKKIPNANPNQSKKSTSKATQRAQYLDQFETIDESTDKILHVLGDDQMPPEIMYQEAYFRLELMDGSHIKMARNYLASQTDLSNDKNMKFVIDFVSSTSSKEFNFLIENRGTFEDKFGTDRVKRTIDVLVYKTMYNAFPRPTLEELLELARKTGMENASKTVYHYFLNRMIEEGNDSQIKRITGEYLPTDPSDHEFMYLAGRYYHTKPNYTREDTRRAIQLLSTAVDISNNAAYKETLRELYLKNGDVKKANKLMSKS